MEFSSDFARVISEDDKELRIRIGGFNGLFDAVVQLFLLCIFVYILIIRQDGVFAKMIGVLVIIIGYTILSMQCGQYIIRYFKLTGLLEVTRKSYFGLLSIKSISSESPVREWRVEKAQDWRGRRGFEPYTFSAITESGEVVRCSNKEQFLESSLKDIIILLKQEVNKTRSHRTVQEVNS